MVCQLATLKADLKFSCRCKSSNGSLNKVVLTEGVRRRRPTVSRNSGSLFAVSGT